MTTIEITLPDATAKAAQEAGLLTPAALEQLITDAIRRNAGRRLLEAAQRIREASVEEMTMEEINAEVHAARAERRARKGAQPDGDASRS
jgi:hypothetical protein